MAKKTSGIFFLRKTLTSDGATFAQDSLDISSFVNLTDGECVRIKNIWFEWTSDDFFTISGTDIAASGAAAGASISGQVTTDSKSTIHSFAATGMVAKNNLYAHIDATANIDFISQDTGLNPYDFQDGYIVATDSIYFGAKGSAVDTWANDLMMTVLLECETVKLSKDDATALLVGQTLG
jgi:hypothetical protein